MADMFIDAAAEEQIDDDQPDSAHAAGGNDDRNGSSSEEKVPDEDASDDDFLAKDEEEEGNEESEEEVRKKNKKRRHQLILEEEDYELLEENLGIRHARPERRRIKKARDVAGEAAQQSAAEQLKAELFGLEDSGLEDDVDDQQDRAGIQPEINARQHWGGSPRDDDIDIEDEDDEDNWIVDEFEDGQRPRRKRQFGVEGRLGLDDGAVEEAHEIFGDASDLLAVYDARRQAALKEGGMEAEVPEEDEYGEELEEDDLEGGRASLKLASKQRLQDQLEPEAIGEHFMQQRDEVIRDSDIPEREQLHRGKDPEAFDVEECAQWIWEHLVGAHAAIAQAQRILQVGAREVEGAPPQWLKSNVWPSSLLRNGLADTQGCRGFFEGRRHAEEQDRWLENAAAQEDLRISIKSALQLLYDQHEEVPLMAMYRKELLGELLALSEKEEPLQSKRPKEYYANLQPDGALNATQRRIRRWDVLFAVQELSNRWRALKRSKEVKETFYQRALKESVQDRDRGLLERCLELLSRAASPEAIQDCEYLFRTSSVSMDEDEAQVGASRLRRAAAFHIASQSGLLEFVHAFFLGGDQLGDNITLSYKKYEPTDPDLSPKELAESYIDPGKPMCKDVETVLRSASHLAAAEVAAEPAVRQLVRESFWNNAVLSTEPTAAGEAALDPFHRYAIARQLKDKPLRGFAGKDTYLRIAAAERDGLVKVSLHIPPSSIDLISTLSALCCSGSLEPGVQEWNEQRTIALQHAVQEILLPGMEREARARLAAEARSAVLHAISEELWKFASRAPLQIQHIDEEEDFVLERRFMAACYGPGSPATTFVMLDAAGNMVDYLHCPQFSGVLSRRKITQGVSYSIFTDERRREDAAKLRDFIQNHVPHAIIIGVSHPQALELRKYVRTITERILEDNPRAFTSMESGGIQHWCADEELPALWENSAAASQELPNSPNIIRRAVALGRQMLDPLSLLASLCGGAGKAIKALRLHPLQDMLPIEDRQKVVNQVLTSAVAQVGVDLNAASKYAWQAGPLEFVPGLGPRKANALLKAIAHAGGVVESRNQVWKELGVMGNCVFRNSAPYLRLFMSMQGTANLEFDPLDNTRVHPESYEHAVRIAQSAVGDSEADVAVENAFQRPREVLALEIDAYDEHLKQQGAAGQAGTLLSTLIDIQMEFDSPYGDVRTPLQQLPECDLFWLATGETGDTLKPGFKVQATVRYVSEYEVKCTLPELHGLEATLDSEDIKSSATKDTNCTNYFKIGDVITASIKEIDASSFSIKLSTASKEVYNDARWEMAYLKQADPYFEVVPMDERGGKKRQQAQRRILTRPIQHPLYKNISKNDAAQVLVTSGETGQAILGPDTRNSRLLHLSIKTPGEEGVWHLQIKETGQRASGLGLAPPFQVVIPPGIDIDTFDDLEELIIRFVEPLSVFMKALEAHQKWWFGKSWADGQVHLKNLKQTSPHGRLVYYLGAAPKKPGVFIIGYIAFNTPRKEYFVVNHEGFYFNKETYRTIDALIGGFKKHILEMRTAGQQKP